MNDELYPRASVFEVIYNWAELVIRSHVANNVNSAKLIYIATDGCRNINLRVEYGRLIRYVNCLRMFEEWEYSDVSIFFQLVAPRFISQLSTRQLSLMNNRICDN